MTQFSAGDRVAVLLPLPLSGPFDYQLADGQSAASGDFVAVPLGRRSLIGVVWGAAAGDSSIKCRPVERVLPTTPLPELSRKFVDWVAQYCLAAPGAVLRMVLCVPKALLPPPPDPPRYIAADPLPDLAFTTARRTVLSAARLPMSATALARSAGVGVAVVKALVAQAALVTVDSADRADLPQPDPQRRGETLSPEQEQAAQTLSQTIGAGFSVTLLEGVTGSGKTEVYFEALAAALKQGLQVLVLLPEIALSAQWLARFERRFGAAPRVWHSDIGEAKKRRTWREVADASAKVVVGARSALFLPFDRLGLIIVDEEHDQSFKQEDGVCYHARDMAVVRASLGALPIILATATPSLESAVNVETGRYRHLILPNRFGGANLPQIDLVDLRRAPPPRGRFISPKLQEAVAQCLSDGQQALLFLNRRGYAPLTLCGACGFRLQCPNCSAWLVDHRSRDRLQCHHCGHAVRLPAVCPHCQAEDRFTACGPGVERVAEEAAALFPEARIAVMASDLLPGPKAAADLVERMARREVDLLIGTQIVAKGHHFPLLTLVGVIDADLGLAGGDLRAAERSFQLLNQVAGRAGRAAHAGRVLLQSYQPEAAVMQALARGDTQGFIAAEQADRRAGGWPPFGRLAALIVSGPDAAMVEQAAAGLASQAPRDPAIEILGPAPAPLALLRGRHRRRLLVKSAKQVNLQAYLRHWLGRVKLANAIRVQVDIDPYNFM